MPRTISRPRGKLSRRPWNGSAISRLPSATPPAAGPKLWQRSEHLRQRLLALLAELRGDPVYGRVQEAAPPSIRGRVNSVAGSQWHVTAPPTRTQREQYRYAADAFGKLLPKLHRLIRRDLKSLDDQLETLALPWTPGRLPEWKPESTGHGPA